MIMFQNRIFIFFVLLLLLFPSFQGSYSNGNEWFSTRRDTFNQLIINRLIENENSEFIDATIEKWREQNRLKGIAVAIVKDEKLIFAKGYGYANEEAQIKVTPNHLFRIASVSKLVTAIAVMKLVENSKISLDSKVFGKQGILSNPEFLHIKDKRLEKITVRNLLNHSGGWTQRYGDLAFLPKVVAKGVGEPLPVNIDSYIKFVTTHKVHFEPGTNSVYSNLGYVILGKVIATVSGMSYEEYVKEEVLKPAGIENMQLGRSYADEALPNEVKYYEPDDTHLTESYDGSGRMVSKTYGANDIYLLGSAGGWLSSPVDLMKLLDVVDNNPQVKDILSPESIREMTRVDPNGLDPLGWRGTNKNGEWWRTGTLSGSSALVKREPNGFSWVVLSNTSNYKGPHLAIEMDRLMSNIISKTNHWPNYDLFSFLSN